MQREKTANLKKCTVLFFKYTVVFINTTKKRLRLLTFSVCPKSIIIKLSYFFIRPPKTNVMVSIRNISCLLILFYFWRLTHFSILSSEWNASWAQIKRKSPNKTAFNLSVPLHSGIKAKSRLCIKRVWCTTELVSL